MDVAAWLQELGLGVYARAFAEHRIDGATLRSLTAEDLKELGVGPIGHRHRLLDAIAALPGVAGHHLPAEAALAAERRHLTVLFGNLAGATRLAARLDPEEMREIISAYQECCAKIIDRHHGHVTKFIGDGLLAYFGFPRALEHAAERAVRAGLALVEAIERLALPGGLQLQARVGIASGLVVVGHAMEATAAREVVAVGGILNLAARLQALAAPGAVVVASSTRRLLGELFRLEDLGPQRVKGFAQPVAAWRVVGENPVESRFEALHGPGLVPLVGRAPELGILAAAWQRAAAGDGQVVLLSGPAGIGKSRLAQVFRTGLEPRTGTTRVFGCSPYHQGTALHPFCVQLRRAVGIERDDPPELQLDRLEDFLARSGVDARDAMPLLAPLLSIPCDEQRHPAPTLNPQRRKERTLEALAELFTAPTDGEPILLVFEDAHWSDATSLDLLERIVLWVRARPALLLVTFRPDHPPPWAERHAVTRLALDRLSAGESAKLVEGLTEGRGLPGEVLGQLVAKAGGIPLFLEELTKAMLVSGQLLDRGTRYELAGPLPELAIPATLHDSLMAQLDRLAVVKQVTQIGAVIGQEFTFELLAMLASMPEERLRSALGQLVDADLLHRSGESGRDMYAFKHVLVRDAAYESLLRSRRRQMHVQIAVILEGRGVGEVEPELLAHHYTAAGCHEAAIDYWHRAGDLAVRRSANAEAILHFRKALELLGNQPEGPARHRQELALQLALAAPLMAARGYSAPEVGQVLARAMALCGGIDDGPAPFPILFGLCIFHVVRTELRTARELAVQCLGVAEQAGDEDLLVEACGMAGMTALYLGELGEGRALLEQGLALYRPERHRAHATVYGQDPIAVLAFVARNHALLGYPDQARGVGRDLLRLAEDPASYPNSVAALHCQLAALHLVLREGAAARARAEAAIAVAAAQDLPLWLGLGRMYHGAALIAEALATGNRQQAAEGVAQGAEGIAAYRATGAGLDVVTCLAWLAAGHGALGRPAEGLRLLEEASAIIAATGECYQEAEVHRLVGALTLALPEPDEAAAEAAFQASLAVARRQQARLLELRAATSLARLWWSQRRGAVAHSLLATVHRSFGEGFDVPDLREAKALREELVRGG